jgi:hypothetical protein
MDLTLVFFGLITWFPICVWVSCMIHWAIMGDLEWYLALPGTCLALVLGIVAIHPPVEILSPICCGAAYVTVLLYPAVQVLNQRRQQKEMDVDDMDEAYRILGQTPGNPLAKFKLAQSVYRLGYIGHAIALGDVALQGLPERVATEEYRMLKRWKRGDVPADTLRPIPCVECHTYCQPGWTHCRNCGAQFLLHRVRGKILPSSVFRKLVSFWAAAILLLIGLPIAASLQTGPAVTLVAALAVAVGAILFFTLRRRSEFDA